MKKPIDSGIGSRVYNHSVLEKPLTKPFLRSGELARLTGVSPDTLRHYERKGLLSSRRSTNGYREYSSLAVDRVRVIRRAIACGFTIDELATILKARDQGDTPCHQVRRLALAKLAAVEEQLRELEIIRDDLRSILDDWEERLSQTAENQAAGLLDSLANRESVSRKNHTPIKRPSRKPNFQENP